MLKSPTTIIDLSIYPNTTGSAVGFCFIYFKVIKFIKI